VGQKVHPIGFRLGVIREADSRWFADKRAYPGLLTCDHQIRQRIKRRLGLGNISRVDIERAANKVRVTLFTARPGAVIGKGGRDIESLTNDLQRLVDKFEKGARVHVNVSEVRQPELDAQLVAENIAQQLERRISHRRAMRQALTRSLRMNGRGIKVIVSGRLNGAEIARRESDKYGKIPLHTLRADIDYGIAEARTTYGIIGVRVWIYKGEVLPERPGADLPIRRNKVETEAQPAPAPAPAVAATPEAVTELPAAPEVVTTQAKEVAPDANA
jgi:small subunit ribosomal protein S3